MNDTNDAITRGVCYPAVFHQETEGGYWVSFPDLPECFTQGSDISEARAMAADALQLAVSSRLEAGETVPAPSASALAGEDGTSFVAAVEALIPSSKAGQVY